MRNKFFELNQNDLVIGGTDMKTSKEGFFHEETRKFDDYLNAAKYLVELSADLKTKNCIGVKLVCQFKDIEIKYSNYFKNEIREKDLKKVNMPEGLYPLFLGRPIHPGSSVCVFGKEIKARTSKLIYLKKDNDTHTDTILSNLELFNKQLQMFGLPNSLLIINPLKDAVTSESQKLNSKKTTDLVSDDSTKKAISQSNSQRSQFVSNNNVNMLFAKSSRSITFENGEMKIEEKGPIATIDGQSLDASKTLIEQLEGKQLFGMGR